MSRFDDKPVGADESGRPYLVRVSRRLDPDRSRGALLGLAVGDALGTTLEFQVQGFSAVERHEDITGGGPFGLVAGQVTDDTQMAVALARSLMERGGFVVDDVAASYVEWKQVAFDVGAQTGDALDRVAAGTAPSAAGRETWIARGRDAAGNGSLMRTAPIGLFYDGDAPRRREVAMAESAITHYDPRCQLACAAFDGALAAAVKKGADAAGMIAAAREDLAAAADTLRGGAFADEVARVDEAEALLASDLDAASAADPGLASSELHIHKMQGYVRVAFRLAFWTLVHAKDFKSGLVDVVNRGGDSDTNGAIAGALLGARMGASAIPQGWQDKVLGALRGKSGPFATTYHPRVLLELLPWDD